MEAFLNELSLHGQFHDTQGVGEAIRRVNSVLFRLKALESPPKLFFDKKLYYSRAIAETVFSSCLNTVADNSIRTQFKQLRDKLGAREWRTERRHEECSYEWNEQNVEGSSVAELAERSLQKTLGFLLCFTPSDFSNGSIRVDKEGGSSATLDVVGSEGELREWYSRSSDPALKPYDPTCRDPPHDWQTVLRDRGRFQRTTYVNQGRRVYLEKSTGYYWCVDNIHFGSAAHIEVFDATGDHVGEAGRDGNLDVSKRDPTKKLLL